MSRMVNGDELTNDLAVLIADMKAQGRRAEALGDDMAVTRCDDKVQSYQALRTALKGKLKGER